MSEPARPPRKAPRRYSRRVHRTICDALEKGCYRQTAFRLAGIHPNTGWEWLRAGNEEPDEHPEYARLVADVEAAEARCELAMLEMVQAAAFSKEPQTWQAAMTLLERRWPDRFGRRDTTVIEGGASPLQVKAQSILLDPEAQELSAALLHRLANPKPPALDPGDVDGEDEPTLGAPPP